MGKVNVREHNRVVTSLLPPVETEEEYRPVCRRPDVWLPAMRVICQRHGLDAARLELAPPGTHVVFGVGERYIKLFAPPWREDALPERLSLAKLSGRPDLPVPQLVAEGEIEGWPYVVLTTVAGVPLSQVWDEIEPPGLVRIAARCGELMGALHATPVDGLEPLAVDWPAFIEEQTRDCAAYYARSGLSERWKRSITAFLDDLPPLFEPGFRPVLLNADITDEHILVRRRGGQWQVTGLIDFGDARLGHPCYDFVAVGCSVTWGSPDALRAMLLAYGYPETRLDATLSRRLMAYTLLHDFIRIPDLLDWFDFERPASFRELARALWSFSDEGI